ncbi:hypothetical protein J437_LFUL001809 [Ladona fulva]|uniref:Uncharacterized protein n=1 Tax=Ladona fulva TaxID=123851 RepID=A0A8K0JYF6_LADFU|nr:hypothetical protein J437_LFUL001809 [Ladona fulva]
MNDEFDRKDVAHFAFISATSIPSTTADLNQQFTPILSNPAASVTPLPAYAYLNDASGIGAYYFQTNSLQPQLNSFAQQPSVTFERFNSGQSPGYQFNPPIMMVPQVNPNGIIHQEAATGTQDITTTNPFQNQQYLYPSNPQPQEIFSSTLNNGYYGTNPPTSFFNNISSNFSGVPNGFIRTESMINQIPQLQRFSCINGNDISFSSPTPTPIQANWSFASQQLNDAKEIVNRVTPSNVEVQQNYLLRIEQVTLISAMPIDSNDLAGEQVSSDQTSTNVQQKYTANSEGLTVLSQVGDNKPQVIKIDSECIKQMLQNNSCFYVQQFLNGPKGKIKKEETTAMQTDGSLRTDIVEIDNEISEPTKVIQILEPRDLLTEEVCDDLQKKTSEIVLEYDGKGVAEENERPLGENETTSEPESRSFDENNQPILDK